MEAMELVKLAIGMSGHQLRKALEGFPEEHYDTKLCPEGMSVRETLEHLGECYTNSVPYADGIQPDWGNYKVEDKSWDNLMKIYTETREAAVQKTMTLEGQKLAEISLGFIVAHDTYHVGQICMIRLHVQPDWNALAIYE